MQNDENESAVVMSAIVLAVLIFSFFLFGIVGIRIVVGIILVLFPFYLILNNFQFEKGEKFVFSLLMGLTLFSSLVYILGLLISFRISILITFIALIILSCLIKLSKSKSHSSS